MCILQSLPSGGGGVGVYIRSYYVLPCSCCVFENHYPVAGDVYIRPPYGLKNHYVVEAGHNIYTSFLILIFNF